MNPNTNALIEKIVENLIHTHPLLSKGFTRSIRTRTNLNPGSIFIIGVLKKHGVLSMSEIGCKLSMPKPHVTAQIDKLIAEEMVERLYDPRDRRIINIRLTDKGLEDFEAIKQELILDFKERVSRVDEEKLGILAESTQVVRDILTDIMIENNTDTSACSKK